MTLLTDRPAAAEGPEPADERTGRGLVEWLTTGDHKKIGILYMVTAFAFFLVGGGLAEVIRTQLARPELELVGRQTYNELFTMHGSIMLFLFLGPFGFGLANYFVPLHIGAPDLAFPRLNALSYWLYLGGGITMCSGFLTARGAAQFGWTAYEPLSNSIYSPGAGHDLWIVGVALTGFSGIFTAVNVITTVFTLRAPGMTMFRVPIFTWNMLVTSFLVLLAFPTVTAALVMLWADRNLGAHFFDATVGGSPVLYQHLFWFFGHPEVYILVLPFFGVVTEVISAFSNKPIFGYKGIVLATLAIAGLSMSVWAHHMFTTGAVELGFFSAFTMLIAVPTGVKFFNWIATMWQGQVSLTASMLFAIAFLLTFVMGGITGVMLGSPPIDFQMHDSYFVVAHFHYTLMGGSVFALFAGIHYWWPKVTGRMLSEGIGKLTVLLMFVGFHMTFLVQHQLGMKGMPRRVATYQESDGFGTLNLISTLGAYVLGISVLVFCWNAWRSLRRGERAPNNPWGGGTLEWWTSSPPPSHNFESLPPIRSERPVFDVDHPEMRDKEPSWRARQG